MLNKEEEVKSMLNCVSLLELISILSMHCTEVNCVQVRLNRKNKGKCQRSGLSPTFTLDLPQGH